MVKAGMRGAPAGEASSRLNVWVDDRDLTQQVSRMRLGCAVWRGAGAALARFESPLHVPARAVSSKHVKLNPHVNFSTLVGPHQHP